MMVLKVMAMRELAGTAPILERRVTEDELGGAGLSKRTDMHRAESSFWKSTTQE